MRTSLQFITVFRGLLALVLALAANARAQVNIPVGTLAPGETVTITFDVTIANPVPAGISAITNQTTAAGANFTTVNSDNPKTTPLGDPTITPLVVPPTVLTLAASNLFALGATLNGSVIAATDPAAYFFQFDTTTNYTTANATNTLPVSTNTVVVSNALSGLSPATLYFFRLVGTNSAGTNFGASLNFTTLALPFFTQLLQVSNTGPFQGTFNGGGGSNFSVYASTNLSNWAFLGPATNIASNLFQFADPAASNLTRRFYQLRTP